MPTGIYQHKKGYKLPPFSEEHKRKISEAMKGKIRLKEKNGHWKGNRAGYQARHKWIRDNWGNAIKCEHCKDKNKKRYEWANISGEYKRDISDYIQLCRSCHIKYDGLQSTGNGMINTKSKTYLEKFNQSGSNTIVG